MEISVDLNGYLDRIKHYQAAAATTVGRQLRECRVARGLTIRDIAAETRISCRFLEAIEEGNYQILPGGEDLLQPSFGGDVYVKNFIRSYARCIGFCESISFEIRKKSQEQYLDVIDAPISVISPEHHRPPKLAEYLLYLFLTKGERIYLIGDLAEEYDQLVSEFGKTAAKLWYYKQVVTSLGPLIRRSVGRVQTVISIIDIIQKIRSH